MSRGLIFGNSGRACSMALTGISGELVAASATGSAARAQHPHVTQAGGQLLSLLPAGSFAVQGSALTKLTTPEALNVRSATMNARANRRTGSKCITRARHRRYCTSSPCDAWRVSARQGSQPTPLAKAHIAAFSDDDVIEDVYANQLADVHQATSQLVIVRTGRWIAARVIVSVMCPEVQTGYIGNRTHREHG